MSNSLSGAKEALLGKAAGNAVGDPHLRSGMKWWWLICYSLLLWIVKFLDEFHFIFTKASRQSRQSCFATCAVAIWPKVSSGVNCQFNQSLVNQWHDDVPTLEKGRLWKRGIGSDQGNSSTMTVATVEGRFKIWKRSMWSDHQWNSRTMTRGHKHSNCKVVINNNYRRGWCRANAQQRTAQRPDCQQAQQRTLRKTQQPQPQQLKPKCLSSAKDWLQLIDFTRCGGPTAKHRLKLEVDRVPNGRRYLHRFHMWSLLHWRMMSGMVWQWAKCARRCGPGFIHWQTSLSMSSL